MPSLKYDVSYGLSAGISCPRAPNVRDEKAGEPFGKEALFFTKELIMHREVGKILLLLYT